MRFINPDNGVPFFSKRRRRFDTDKCPHELTFSCYQGYRFLERDRVRRWLVDAIEDVRPNWPVDLWAYVFMPEHVHILVAPREPGVEVGRFIGSIKEKTARRAVSWLETNAPSWIRRITVWEGNRERRRFWQPGGGYDRNVRNETALVSMIEYIHANPVRRGLVRSPEDWEWSSAGWYAGGRDVPLAMDETLPFLTE